MISSPVTNNWRVKSQVCDFFQKTIVLDFSALKAKLHLQEELYDVSSMFWIKFEFQNKQAMSSARSGGWWYNSMNSDVRNYAFELVR